MELCWVDCVNIQVIIIESKFGSKEFFSELGRDKSSGAIYKLVY